MANAVASSSRDRPARNRSSIQSLRQYDHQGVVMTHEIRHKGRPEGLDSDTIKIINQYQFKFKVGRGQHGEVYLAEDSANQGMPVAVKCVRRKNKNDRMRLLKPHNNLPRSPHTPLVDQLGSTEHKIRKEIAIMKKLNHPHVVRLLEVIDDPLNDKIYMVMEYLGGGEIKWRTKGDDPLLRVDQTRRICRDVILGLEYLHYQGIIHRDIKPANLLWTADRRTVKISDFGVSTFSYAQRLAAAGKGTIKHDDTDPILMDESDLSKTAGTPMFLAPELVSDSVGDQSASATNTPQSQTTTTTTTKAQTETQTQTQAAQGKKPQVTKAIDIWAFGVTLYGLLFGILPFRATSVWEIYGIIRTQDWDVPEKMGLDQLPTGGRHPEIVTKKPNGRGKEKQVLDTEGAQVIDLLEKLLEKDSQKRITLEGVKRHPWILRDLEKPEEWLRETRLSKYLQLEPTHDETKSALSAVRFRWLPRIGNRILSTLRSVKPQRSFRRAEECHERHDGDHGTQSAPHMIHLARQQTANGPIRHVHHHSVREKSKRRSRQDNLQRNKSTNDIVSGTGSKPAKAGAGFEPWGIWNSSSTPSAGPSNSKRTEMGLKVPKQQAGSSRLALASPLPSPITVGSSQVSTPVGESSISHGHSPDSERPRSMVMNWVRKLGGSHRQSSYSAYDVCSPMTESTTALAFAPNSRSQYQSGYGPGHHPVAATAPPSRDSADAFSGHPTSRQSSVSMSMGGKLTKAMRAASWTAPDFMYARPSEDMTSVYSGDRQDDFDDEVLLYGAGGFAHSPVPSIPNSALLSSVSSAHSIGPPSMSAAHAILSRTEGAPDVPEALPTPDSTANTRPSTSSQARLRTTSPLAQVSYHASGTSSSSSGISDDSSESSPSSGVSYDSADDDSSIYDRPVRTAHHSHSRPHSHSQSQSRHSRSRSRSVSVSISMITNGMIVNEDTGDVDDGHSGAGSFDLQPSTSQMYRDEDEESEDEDEVPLEVRTRRPSASAADMGSPPGRSLSAHQHQRRPPPSPSPSQRRHQEGKQRPMICA